MISWRVAALCAAAFWLAFSATTVWPVDLGVLHWKSASGGASYAEIQLNDRVLIDASTLRTSIASQEAYSVAGLAYHAGFAAARLSVHAADGRTVLRVENLPQDAPTLDLLIVVSNRLALSLAEYRVNTRSGAPVQPSPAGTLHAAQPRASVPKPEKPSISREIRSSDEGLATARQFLLDWAQAWSRRDVDAYISAYTPDYSGEGQRLSRQEWIAQRRARILARKRIVVELAQLRLERDGANIVATFDQHYRGDGLNDRIRKRMILVSVDGSWRIKSEAAN